MLTEVPNSGLRNNSTRWKTGLGMASALAAQASGSPPASLTTWVETLHGNIRDSLSSSVKFSTSAENAAISSVSMARAARRAGIRGDAFNGVSERLCRIRTRSLGPAPKNIPLISAASVGCIDKVEAIRNCTSRGALIRGAAEGIAGIGLAGINSAAISWASGTR
jgi:hypothetical protein